MISTLRTFYVAVSWETWRLTHSVVWSSHLHTTCNAYNRLRPIRFTCHCQLIRAILEQIWNVHQWAIYITHYKYSAMMTDCHQLPSYKFLPLCGNESATFWETEANRVNNVFIAEKKEKTSVNLVCNSEYTIRWRSLYLIFWRHFNLAIINP